MPSFSYSHRYNKALGCHVAALTLYNGEWVCVDSQTLKRVPMVNESDENFVGFFRLSFKIIDFLGARDTIN